MQRFAIGRPSHCSSFAVVALAIAAIPWSGVAGQGGQVLTQGGEFGAAAGGPTLLYPSSNASPPPPAAAPVAVQALPATPAVAQPPPSPPPIAAPPAAPAAQPAVQQPVFAKVPPPPPPPPASPSPAPLVSPSPAPVPTPEPVPVKTSSPPPKRLPFPSKLSSPPPAPAPVKPAQTQAPRAAPTPAPMPPPAKVLQSAAPKPTAAPPPAPTPKPTAAPTPAPTKAAFNAPVLQQTPPPAAEAGLPPSKAAASPDLPPLPGVQPASASGFIRAVNTKFVDADCNAFIPYGWNSWHLIETLTGSTAFPDAGVIPAGQTFLQYTFGTAKKAGFNTFRFFALGDNDDNRNAANLTQFALQPEPGVYNETIFRATDRVLAAADIAGLKVIVTLIDNWKLLDGAPQYQAWCTGEPFNTNSSSYENVDNTPFWVNPKCQQLYKAHVKTVVTRRNTVNGRIYRDDPTILAWDLYNEPRCQDPCSGKVQPWIQMMASYFKSLDSKHMLTVGEEGFFGPSSPFKSSNPVYDTGATWPSETGQDFVANHASPDLDFSAIHLWPDRWTETDPSFAAKWVSGHIKAAQALGKPLLLEEFGKLMPRDEFYKAVFVEVESAARAGGILQGALFWLFQSYTNGQNMTNGHIDRVDYGVIPRDSTWSLISGTGNRLANLPPRKVADCTIGSSGPPPQVTTGPGAVAG